MTTICAVKKDNQVAMAGDGQVTMGEKVIMKGTARKIRRIFDNQVLVGFAGGVADAITLEEMFEDKAGQLSGHDVVANDLRNPEQGGFQGCRAGGYQGGGAML